MCSSSLCCFSFILQRSVIKQKENILCLRSSSKLYTLKTVFQENLLTRKDSYCVYFQNAIFITVYFQNCSGPIRVDHAIPTYFNKMLNTNQCFSKISFKLTSIAYLHILKFNICHQIMKRKKHNLTGQRHKI